MDLDEKIYAHILSVWKEPKEFFGGRSLEGMLILTDKHLMFVRKTEAKMRWWGRCYTKTGNQVHTFQGCYDYSRWLHGRKS